MTRPGREMETKYEEPLDYPHPLLAHTERHIAGCQLGEEPGGGVHHSPDCPGCMVRLAAAAVRRPRAKFRVVETGESISMVAGFRLRCPDETHPLRVVFERALAQKLLAEIRSGKKRHNKNRKAKS